MIKVDILGGSGESFRFDDFEKFLDLSGSKASPSPKARIDLALPVDPANPEPWKRLDETPEQRVERVKLRLRNLRDPDRRAMALKILEGKPFAEPGRRDEDLNRMAATLAFLEPALEVEEMVSIFHPSIVAMAAYENSPNNPSPTDDDVRVKCERKLEQARAAKVIEHATHERIRRGLLREARESSKAQEEGTAADEEERGEYADEEIASFAASQDCDTDHFQKRWIIQRGPSYYVFVNGSYRSPLSKEELETSLERDLAPVPEQHLTWLVMGTNGNLRRKKISEFLRDYATVARDISADLTLKRSYYDPTTQIFHEAVCPLRRLEPLYDERVDQWLRLFGGSETDKLLDWIATLTRLDSQTCALYMTGPPGSGKTVLTQGLAKLWSTQGKLTELGRILDNFNSDLTQCPIIFADEHIVQNWKGQRASAELRQLVGSNTRTLSRKFMPNASLNGAIRLVLAANNDMLLAFDGEDLSADDLEAIQKRFLHVRTTLAAAQYLRQLGGKNGQTSAWVDGDLIARHALWLAANRKVLPGERFLVEGRMTDLVARMPTQGKTSSLVCEWLVQFLDAPEEKRRAIESTGLVLVGNNEYLVNVKAISTTWTQFISSDGPPRTGQIGRVLKLLSRGTKRVDDARFHVMNLDLIFAWADDNQVGKPDMMRSLVARAVTDNMMAPIRRMSLRAV